LKYVIYLHNNI